MTTTANHAATMCAAQLLLNTPLATAGNKSLVLVASHLRFLGRCRLRLRRLVIMVFLLQGCSSLSLHLLWSFANFLQSHHTWGEFAIGFATTSEHFAPPLMTQTVGAIRNVVGTHRKRLETFRTRFILYRVGMSRTCCNGKAA